MSLCVINIYELWTQESLRYPRCAHSRYCRDLDYLSVRMALKNLQEPDTYDAASDYQVAPRNDLNAKRCRTWSALSSQHNLYHAARYAVCTRGNAAVRGAGSEHNGGEPPHPRGVSLAYPQTMIGVQRSVWIATLCSKQDAVILSYCCLLTPWTLTGCHTNDAALIGAIPGRRKDEPAKNQRGTYLEGEAPEPQSI